MSEQQTERQITPPIHPTKALERNLEARAAQAKEDRAKWAKDHPLREPGTSLKGWKSYSKQRFPSIEFRNGYEQINWEEEDDAKGDHGR